MKIIHIIPNEKFTEPFIHFLNDEFTENDHLFIIIGEGISSKINKRSNVIEILNIEKYYMFIYKELFKCRKIILHSLFNRRIVQMLFVQPWLLKKCYWVVWGADLYEYRNARNNLKSKLYEVIRHFVIKRMSGLITHIKGDYELAQKWYRVRGSYHYSFMYPSNLYKEYDISNIKKNNEKKFIQIGNSSDPTNNHLEVLKKLEEYKDKIFEIICPLSYGDYKYRELVIEEGTKLFGGKFIPILDFMPFENYLELLAKIDIAIFNHDRQQGMGNIITLIGLGKKVYIRDDITTWKFCSDHALKVYNSNKEFSKLFNKIPEYDIKNNIDNIMKYFSEKKLKEDLKAIFQ